MKKNIFIILFFILILGGAVFFISRTDRNNPNSVNLGPNDIVFFSKDGCPYCAAEEGLLDELKKDYPQIKINKLKVTDKNNANLLKELYEKYQVPPGLQGLVPATFVKDKYFVGFDDKTKEEIKSYFSQSK